MLKWMSAHVTKMDRVRNEYNRGSEEVHSSVKESPGGKVKMVWLSDEKK